VSLGERIRKSRNMAGLSQSQLGDRIETDANTISRWERDSISPKAETIIKIAQALNTSVSYLLGETDDPARPSSLLFRGSEGDNENYPLPHTSEEQKKIATEQRRNSMCLDVAPIAAIYDDVRERAGNTTREDRALIAEILKRALEKLESDED